jgi:hypothetical protein
MFTGVSTFLHMEALDAERKALACEYHPPTMTWCEWRSQGIGLPIATSTGTAEAPATRMLQEVFPNRERGWSTLRPTCQAALPPGSLTRRNPQISL